MHLASFELLWGDYSRALESKLVLNGIKEVLTAAMHYRKIVFY